MTDQERAKAAVALLPKIEAALYGKNDLTNGEVASIVATLDLLRPLAVGDSVIVPIEQTEKMVEAGVIGSEVGDVYQIYRAMIAASQEGEIERLREEHTKAINDIEGASETIFVLRAENERLKGEYSRGIEDAAKWHDKEIVEITSQLDRGIANSDGEIQMVLERIFHKRVATEIRALIPKQKEGE